MSSFDQAPMDHNRTALPVSTLAQVMKNDRTWFLSLDPVGTSLRIYGFDPFFFNIVRYFLNNK